MIIGVAAVISMVSIGNGAKASVEKEISSAGTNLIMVMSGSARQASGLDPIDALRDE